MKTSFVSILIIHLLFAMQLEAQNKIKDFLNLSIYEKIWVTKHPFVAKKTWEITKKVQQTTERLKMDSVLDGKDNGGQLDAFRHSYWMAILTQELNARKARQLGLAHERKNKADFRKSNYEHGSIPDAISIKMDLLNNQIGMSIGSKYPNVLDDNLVNLIIEKILSGDLWIVKTDFKGNYLNHQNKILTENEYTGTWENAKCLVKSNYLSN